MTTGMGEPICLVIPPSAFLLDERVFVSLGILKVAAVLEQAGYTVEMIDLSGIENYDQALQDHVTQSAAKVYGITSTTPQMPAAAKISAVIRKERPDSRIILGGPHVTLTHAAYKARPSGRAAPAMKQILDMADVVVVGDGEEAVFQALREDPPRIVDADIRQSPLFLTNQKLEILPPPARHLVDLGSYHYSIEGHSATSLIAQLGCPFECGFCGGRQSSMLRVIRTRSNASVVEEIRQLHLTYGYTGFMFYDDELNVNTQMVDLMQQLTHLQKELKVDFRLRGFVKAELFTEPQADAMFTAGFRWLLTGFESGSPTILANMNKKATREQNCRAVSIARKHGLKVKALMSIGHPGESRQTVEETRDWLLEVKPDDFDATIITTYPGTPYHDLAVPHPEIDNVWTYTCKKSGDRLHSYELNYGEVADYYKGDPEGGYRAYVFTDELTSVQLVEARNGVERDVRERLNIPFNPGASSIRYEHSMGQSGELPGHILRRSPDRVVPVK